ncbi:helicase HerA-like domain-containing protein [Tropicimonas sp. IMCC34043]|uniref:helicase HerA-like domain-containing protein n=1 Tax=Tropicimonas sp. IMCC34043 TaxID=2248760 RepID=UPI000E255EE0|nr:helicase HerA-like domain-containing protein [Tropicimonas sp. IMCC34043]
MDGIFVGGGGAAYGAAQNILLRLGNRHGLIAGATGTGKTVTLQILAEGFSAAGVPVFLSDVKGDLAGLSLPGDPQAKTHASFTERATKIGLTDYAYRSFPVTFWDIFGQQGHPVRTTLAEMGPLLLARLLDLSEAQEGILNIAFRIADEEGWPLLDLPDLRSLLVWLGENRKALELRYGAISTASVGAIQRRLLVLEGEGGASFFGEPALALSDLMLTDAEGRGRISILAADRLMTAPRLYATFLLWLLSELFETLPEVGDPEKPCLVLFFDEAHLLFEDAPKALVDKVEQVARLIRSKGVGVYFVTQNPDDVPGDILGQLGNRVQHALRAFTAQDRRALKQAAETYRDNPAFDIEAAIREVGTGEAVTSFLEPKGAPGVAERTLIRPPSSRLGAIDVGSRAVLVAGSPLAGKYDTAIDRESAHEILTARAATAAAEAERHEAAEQDAPPADREYRAGRRYTGTRVEQSTAKPVSRRSGSRSDSTAEAFAKSFARQVGTQAGRAVVRGIMGGLFRGK